MAVNWKSSRSNEEFIFRKVAWENWQEHETYDYITNGEIEYAIDAELKVTASFNFEGYELPSPNDLIRVYYRFTNNGEVAEVALGTFFVSFATVDYLDTISGVKAKGTLNGQSVLSVLKNKKVGRPYTIKKGSNAVYTAEDLIRSLGLVPIAEIPSSFVLTSDYTFDSDSTYLDMVNYLLNAASYKEAYPDETGKVILQKATTDGARNLTFKNDEESIMYPEIEQENDWQQTPNVVKVLYNTDEACILATASNVSGSRASLSNRGNREITYVEEVSNVGEGTLATLLKERAENILKSKSSDIEYVTFEHAYIPMSLNDTITVEYSDLRWEGLIDNYSVTLKPSVKTTTKVKRNLTQEITIESGTQIYRS